MTEEEKVRAMFEIRLQECPDIADNVKDRIDDFCNPATKNCQALLRMYNERYGGKHGE